MYELKTLLPAFDIQVPTGMYAMKSLALKRESRKSAEKNSSPTMTKLEDRQNEAIKKLQELRKQLESMRTTLNVSNLPSSTNTANMNQEYEKIPDIVIKAHPKYVPYALLALKNLWKDDFNIHVKCYKHSTLKELTPEAIEFQEKISVQNENKNMPGIEVTFIWKSIEHTELISSLTMFVPIYGEVNIIRYLARIGPQSYRYEDTELANNVDMILDICYQLLRCTTAKTRQPLLRSLDNHLQKQTFFTGNQLSVADIAVSSSIKRTPDAAKDLNENMNKWLTRVKAIICI